MKILIVASYNKGFFSPFITEQAQALAAAGNTISYFGVVGHGVFGYLKHIRALNELIQEEKPDIIHAHYGLCGLLAGLQRRVPVVTTYHGSDINLPRVRMLSRLTMRLSSWNIFVSRSTLDIVKPKRKYSLIPCGIDLTDDQLTDRAAARVAMNLGPEERYVLFAGAFDNRVKNSRLAKQTVELLDMPVRLLELKGYTRQQVTLLMCAADAFLMTSFTEGSPQVVKEAMACGCPIVSVDVGDVRERTEGVPGCYVASRHDASELAALLRKALAFEGKTPGREKIIADGLTNQQVAEKLMQIYHQVSE